MPTGPHNGPWLRSLTAAGACVIALASTGSVVAASVVAHGGSRPAVVLVDDSKGGDAPEATGHGDGLGHAVSSAVAHSPGLSHGNGKGNGDGSGHGDGKPKHPKPTPTPRPEPTKPASHPKPKVVHAAPASHPASHPAAPEPKTSVVVNNSDPAPFSAESVAATDAARVLPSERLGPLSGISFGGGLLIWPLLLAVDFLALAAIARLALRRRLVSPED